MPNPTITAKWGARIRELSSTGLSEREVAKQLRAEGFRVFHTAVGKYLRRIPSTNRPVDGPGRPVETSSVASEVAGEAAQIKRLEGVLARWTALFEQDLPVGDLKRASEEIRSTLADIRRIAGTVAARAAAAAEGDWEIEVSAERVREKLQDLAEHAEAQQRARVEAAEARMRAMGAEAFVGRGSVDEREAAVLAFEKVTGTEGGKS